jgi:prepilin-type N-terminal cleavage/methylation domain-containing protein
MKTQQSVERGAWSVELRHSTRHLPPVTCHLQPADSGFSLVEVVIAIGIFAFVIVGIVGLFPAALRIRAESALDTRSVMIAQQLMAAVDTAPSLSNIIVPTGAYTGSPATKTANLLLTNRPIVLGYASRTTFPYWDFNVSPNSSWTNAGGTDTEIVSSARNEITTLARITATTNNLTNLAQITIEVRSPAALALSNSRVVTFTTYRPFP